MSRWIKRVIDIIVSAILLFLLAPVLLLVGTLIFVTMGKPILFKQARPGMHGKIFIMYKFRTMRPQTGGDIDHSSEARVTRIGKILRSTSIDELPELFNVLKGDMSLVGPRPLLVEYLSHYTKDQMRRHDMKPGVTGLAQVNGRNAQTWDERFYYDLHYVDNWSLFLDFRILFRTLTTVLMREGVNASQGVTMKAFRR